MSTSEPDQLAGVEAAFTELIASFNALDAARFAKCFVPDGSLFAPDSRSGVSLIEGAASVHEHFSIVFAAEGPAGPNIRPVNVRVRLLGAQAALVTFEFARANESLGRRTLVFLSVGEQQWKVAHVHASNTEPGCRAA